MRDLSVQAANDSNNEDTRTNINTEVSSLRDELTRISASTNFNGTNLLDGTAGAGADGILTFQVGAGSDADANQISVDLSTANVATVADNLADLDFTDAATAAEAVETIDTEIESVSTARAQLGAYQNRLEHTINNMNVAIENLSASESRIRDTDMAQEMVSFTRAQILSQAGTAMLAQANQAPQGVLQLLR
jgi:flagellin